VWSLLVGARFEDRAVYVKSAVLRSVSDSGPDDREGNGDTGYQASEEVRRRTRTSLAVEQAAAAEAQAWPKRAPEQYVVLRAANASGPATPADLARRFAKAPRNKMKEMLEALVAMGQARQISDGRFVT
jgi:hypothetical protein